MQDYSFSLFDLTMNFHPRDSKILIDDEHPLIGPATGDWSLAGQLGSVTTTILGHLYKTIGILRVIIGIQSGSADNGRDFCAMNKLIRAFVRGHTPDLSCHRSN